jgi:hypothetical protein
MASEMPGAGQPDLEAYLDTVVLQAEMSPEPLCGPAVETTSVHPRVNKQLVAAQMTRGELV